MQTKKKGGGVQIACKTAYEFLVMVYIASILQHLDPGIKAIRAYYWKSITCCPDPNSNCPLEGSWTMPLS